MTRSPTSFTDPPEQQLKIAARKSGKNRILIAAPFLLALIFSGLLVWVVSREHTLYSYDALTFWLRGVFLASAMQTHPLSALSDLFASMRTQEYNQLAAVGPAVAILIAGTSRGVYVGGMAILYGLLTTAAWCRLIRNQGDADRPRTPGLIFLAILPLLLAPNLWAPLLEGYPDLGGVAIAVAATLVYVAPAAGRRRWRNLAIVGGLLALLVVFRRWQLLWAVSFGLATVVDVIARRWRDGFGATLNELAVTVLLIASAGMAVGVALSWTMLLKMFGTDYNTMYEAYRTQAGYGRSVIDSAANVMRHLGVLPAILMILAVILGLLHRRDRRVTAILLIAGGAAFLLFERTNTLAGSHHVYLLVPTLFVPLSLWLIRPEKSQRRFIIKTVIVVGIGLVNYANAFIATPTESRWPLLSDERLQPHSRSDLPVVTKMLNVLSTRIRQARGPVYVLGSSNDLNASEIMGASLSFDRPILASQFALPASDVDLRDGFPAGLLVARYVIVTDPVQLHLRPSEQQVVEVPAKEFLSGDGIAKAFAPWPVTFPLQDGVTALVFERQRPTTHAEAEDLLNKLRAAHPMQAAWFQLPPS